MEDIFKTAQGQQPTIYKIIYHSQISIEGGPDRVLDGIKQILEWSRAWNPKHGITGALMLNDEHFSQVLEGPSHAVKALFGHIVCDRRHKHVQLLQSDFFLERDFDSWAMAYVGSPTEEDIRLATTPRRRDEKLGEGANGVVALLRWLLLEKDKPAAIR